MKISIVGWYNRLNVGDDAFCCVFRQFFRGHDLEFVTPPNPCNNPDIVILGGGAVVSPFYLNNLPDCPRYALGVDIAYESEMDLLKPLNFGGVMIRNATDLQVLQSKISCPVSSIPDLAFFLKPSGTEILKKYRKHPKKKALGVFATDYVNPAIDRPIDKFGDRANSFKLKMAKEMDMMYDAGYEIILVPCATGGYGDDRRINLDIASFMRHTPTIIFDTLGPQSMIDLIEDLDVSLCMRFHAHIFSMIAGTPMVSIDFTRKVSLFLEENNLKKTTVGTWKDKNFETTRLLETITDVSTDQMSQYLRNTACNYSQQLYDVMRTIRQDWLGQSL